MLDRTALTLHIGPQTRLGRALNDCARLARKLPSANEVQAFPNRVATRSVRHLVLSTKPPAAQREEFLLQFGIGQAPAFLSLLHILGAPQTAFQKGELFPDAEVMLARLADLVSQTEVRIVVTLDTLHHFFLSAAAAPLEARVRKTRWDILYELSWSDLVEEVATAFPKAELVVLTPRGAAMQSDALLTTFFGAAFASTADPQMLARLCLSNDGGKELDRLLESDALTPDAMDRLLTVHPYTPDAAEVTDRLGIDRLTGDLLQQEFLSDLEVIEDLPGVRVL